MGHRLQLVSAPTGTRKAKDIVSKPLYITKPGGVILQTREGAVLAPYGLNVRRFNLTDAQEDYLPSFTNDVPRLSKDEEIALAEAVGVTVNDDRAPVTSASGDQVVPGDYSSLDEVTAAQVVARFDSDPAAQAQILLAEAKQGNRQMVIDAATDEARAIAFPKPKGQEEGNDQKQESRSDQVSPAPNSVPVTVPAAITPPPPSDQPPADSESSADGGDGLEDLPYGDLQKIVVDEKIDVAKNSKAEVLLKAIRDARGAKNAD